MPTLGAPETIIVLVVLVIVVLVLLSKRLRR